jgi:hypothetical protein
MLYVKFLFSVIFYVVLLLSVSPVIDHLFTPLDKDESEAEILVEIMSQIITISIVWYVISEYVIVRINNKLGIKNHKIIDRAREVIAAVIIVGLQSHLIQKLEYITLKHPFRFLNLYGD